MLAAGSLFSALVLPVSGHAQNTLADLTDRASCLIVESQNVELTSPVSGTLAEVSVVEGDRVVAGQAVARLESSVELATAETARARAQSDVVVRARMREREAASQQLERQQELLRRKATPAMNVEEAETEFAMVELAIEEAKFNQQVAELEWKRAQALVERRTVRSPIDGVVTRIELSAGENADTTNTILTISAVDPLQVDVFLPLDAFPLVDVGMPVQVMPQEPIGGIYNVVVATRSPIVDAASGLFRVTLDLPNTDNAVPAGIRCRVAF